MNCKSLVPAIGVFLAMAWPTASRADGEPETVLLMRGFSVDHHLIDERDWKKMAPSLDNQLQIVEAVGVPENVMDYFRTVPLVVDPGLTKMYGEYLQRRGTWFVRIKPAKLPTDRPIVLHELLHAYHREILKLPTPQVGRAYAQAKQANLYPAKYAKAHFLENGREYFAVIGSIFLFGKKIDQPPFTCKIPARAQPEFIAFLAEQFGPHACK